MNAQLIHILDQSACLSRRQMRDYLASSMEQEEQHAVEIHLVACPLCGLAMDGLEKNPQSALAALSEMNNAFLKAHFDTMVPQIHLNSMAPASALSSTARRRQGHTQPIWKHLAIIAFLLGTFSLLWYFEFRKDYAKQVKSISVKTLPDQPKIVPVQAAPAIAAPASKKSHAATIKSDEELIQKAKEMTAPTPAEELSDEELSQLFDESVADQKRMQASTPAASKENPAETSNQKTASDTDHAE